MMMVKNPLIRPFFLADTKMRTGLLNRGFSLVTPITGTPIISVQVNINHYNKRIGAPIFTTTINQM